MYTQYLVECFPEVITWGIPRGHSVTEEHEMLQDTLRVDSDHGTDASEGRVFLLIITNGAECLAPHGQELRQEWSHFRRAHQPQPPNGDGRVLQQGLGCVL